MGCITFVLLVLNIIALVAIDIMFGLKVQLRDLLEYLVL